MYRILSHAIFKQGTSTETDLGTHTCRERERERERESLPSPYDGVEYDHGSLGDHDIILFAKPLQRLV